MQIDWSSDRVRRYADRLIAVLFSFQLVWVTWHLGGFVVEPLLTSFPILVLTLVLVAVRWSVLSHHELPRGWWLPLPFLIWALLHAFGLAEVPGRAQLHALLVFQGAIAYWVGLQLAQTHRAKAVLFFSIGALMIAASAMSIYQRVVDPTWLPMGREQWLYYLTRSSGVFGNPNNFAAWLAMFLPMAVVAAGGRLSSKWWVRLVGAAATIAGLVGIALSQSRGVGLSLVLLLICWFLFGAKWKIVWRVSGTVALLGALVGTGALAYHLFPSFTHRVDAFAEFKGERTRPEMWHIAVELWHDRPLVGNGGGSYGALMEKHRREGLWESPEFAHNDYLNLLSDYGVGGALLLFVPLVMGGWRWSKSRNHGGPGVPTHAALRGALAWGMAILACAVVIDFHLQSPAILMGAGVVLGLFFGQSQHRKRKANAFFTSDFQVGVAMSVVGIMALGGFALVRKGGKIYEAEALRYHARQAIDDLAGVSRPEAVWAGASDAEEMLREAIRRNPQNDRAWADLAYAISLQGYKNIDREHALGEHAEFTALQALDGSDEVAEYWIRLGVALDLQGRWGEAGRAFGRAIRLAPRQPVVWFYQGFHFSLKPMTREMGIAALATCLRLDPSYEEAKLLKVALERSN
ncbi:MAG: hypothetical protein SynsKO_02150 [Synoicihabitans sp.]